MKKAIIINPIDEDIELLANSISILNDYKKLGFVKRESFVELIMGEDTSYHTLQGMQKLTSFWAGRVKDVNLNKDLIRIFENLKSA
jgi:hypothetical protein